MNFFGIFYILQVATTQKLQRFTVNGCVVICGVTAVIHFDQELVFLNRMIDGSCNNQNPILGFHETPFLRLMPNAYDDKCSVPRGGQMNSQLPSPREISLTIPTTFERDSQ